MIGKVADAQHYHLSISLALVVVQEHLRQQGRDQLKVTNATLIQQLVAEGVAFPNTSENSEKATRGISLGEGMKKRCILIRKDAIESQQPKRDKR